MNKETDHVINALSKINRNLITIGTALNFLIVSILSILLAFFIAVIIIHL